MSASSKRDRGALAWMAKNGVAANVVMVVLIIGGLLLGKTIKREVFPEFELDIVLVQIPYPSASPNEVKKSVTLAVEEAVQGLDGVKKVSSTSSEGVAVIIVEVLLGVDGKRMRDDVESAIARISSFPEDIENPVVTLISNQARVLSLMVTADETVSEKELRAFAETTRLALKDDKRITKVELSGVRPPEISIEVPLAVQQQYGLTLGEIARRIRAQCVEVPGGGVKSRAGDKSLRIDSRCESGEDFGNAVVIPNPNGTPVRARDLAVVVKDDFAETDQEAYFNGKRVALVDVYRVGDETPITVSDAVKDYIKAHEASLPPGIEFDIWTDTSEWYRSRVDLLMRNAIIGLILVLVILGLFLEVKLAFWVTMGIPISFIGALLFMPSTDVSINMISLFAFIIVLGMVVDDAIVVGEAVYKLRGEGRTRLEAAIEGVKEVAIPVTFSIITTVIAFSPMLFVSGPAGKFFRVVPITVILVLGISLFESLFILPAHLAHSRENSDSGLFGWIHRRQQRFANGVEWLISHTYVPTLMAAVRNRYLTVAVAIAIFIGSIGIIAGGRLEFTFIPRIENDLVVAEVELPYGSSAKDTKEAVEHVRKAAERALVKLGKPSVSRGLFYQVGAQVMAGTGGPNISFGLDAAHQGEVAINLVDVDHRPFSSSEFVAVWRKEVGEVADIAKLKFTYSTGASAGAAMDFELTHADFTVAEEAAGVLAKKLATYDGVRDIDDGVERGKEQMNFHVTPEGEARGLTAAGVGRQVRDAFFGAEVLRQPRNSDEMRVYVRLPEGERATEDDVKDLRLFTPTGGEMLLAQAAVEQRGHTFTSIRRLDGRRIVNVTADIDEAVANADKITAEVLADILPAIAEQYPGLRYDLGSEQRSRQDSLGNLRTGFQLAMVAIIALLAIVFRSYIQWLVIMIVIPFGFVGAIIGHVIMGYDLSLMSLMGVVALSGVVINDSLILIVAINQYRAEGMTLFEAIHAGGERRFRPILLTSLTTFFGLMPMILETSVQARFLIPMAISLGFGVIFATFIMLLLVPSVYAIVEDLRRIVEPAIRAVFGTEPRELPLRDSEEST